MKSLFIIAAAIFASHSPGSLDVVESSSTGNLEAIAGNWRPIEQCHHLLDEKLVAQDKLGFQITVDEKLGDSHRQAKLHEKDRDSYYDTYAAFLEKNGHLPVATGFIKFDYGSGGEYVISQKDGSLYLWYGVVMIDNPRIFVGRGSKALSAETFVIEWASRCSESPVELERDFASVIYERVDGDVKKSRNDEQPADDGETNNRSTGAN